jgi:putative flippase GtrA
LGDVDWQRPFSDLMCTRCVPTKINLPRDPDFAVKAARALDLYARVWEGEPLGDGDFVISADEKPDVQARTTITRAPTSVWGVTRSDASSARQRSAVEFGKFGTVGAVNFALDLLVFNLLLFTIFHHLPIAAKAASSVIAASSSYFMNRHWTWRHRARSGTRRELTIFLAMSAIALGITEVCLLISHYGLGLTSKLADNVSANAVGLVLATTWRFWSFRKWVFLHPEARPNARGKTAAPSPCATASLG